MFCETGPRTSGLSMYTMDDINVTFWNKIITIVNFNINTHELFKFMHTYEKMIQVYKMHHVPAILILWYFFWFFT